MGSHAMPHCGMNAKVTPYALYLKPSLKKLVCFGYACADVWQKDTPAELMRMKNASLVVMRNLKASWTRKVKTTAGAKLLKG